ncbi:hypothetical protein BGZ67_010797, partial [Mortierella alpina]
VYTHPSAGSPSPSSPPTHHPKHSHLAIPPNRNLRLDEISDLDATDHLIPKSISIGAALDMASTTFESSVVDRIHSINSYPTSTSSYHRVEIVYSDQVDTQEVAVIIPLTINGVTYPSSPHVVNRDLAITCFDAQCFFLRNGNRNIEETLTLATKDFDMGTVIKSKSPAFDMDEDR